MPRRPLCAVMSSGSHRAPGYTFSVEDVVWTMGSFCANRKPFDDELLARQFPSPYNADSFIHAACALGFRIKRKNCARTTVTTLKLPCLAVMQVAATDIPQAESSMRPAITVQVSDEQIILFEASSNIPKMITHAEFDAVFAGTVFQLALEAQSISDLEGALASHAQFGFSWFIPELLKHKRVWHSVLIASLIIQLPALGRLPFTQVIIDKVGVHLTQSTLIGIGLAVFMLFSALLFWVRQYLMLHTGKLMDAVLGAAVFNHLFKWPLRHFEHRPASVTAARLYGVETTCGFVASTSSTMIPDLPFLLIFLSIMLYYSVMLTVVAASMISVIVVISLIVAPIFRSRFNDQFLLGARNLAFTTEYVAGLGAEWKNTG